MRDGRHGDRGLRGMASVATLLLAMFGGVACAAPDHVVAHVDGIELHDGDRRLRVVALTDDILRVRISHNGAWPEDASWAVSPATRAQRVAVRALPAGDAALRVAGSAADVGFRTASLAVRVDPATLALRVTANDGRVLWQDAPLQAARAPGPVSTGSTDERTEAAPRALPRGAAFEHRVALPLGTRVFGLGDKTGPLDRRGGFFVHWNTDVGRFTEATDPLYKTIPFLLTVDGDGRSGGVFLDNTWRSWFDVGKRDPEVLAFGADGGPLDVYVINGPRVADVVQRYTELTGLPPLPPLWSLGYQQSRYSYMSSDEVRSVASRLRAERIPTDVLWLDIDFQDRNRPFTVNPATYGDLPALASTLRGDGFRLVAITDLHVADVPGEGYAPFDSGAAGDHFVKHADGRRFSGKVWPGPSVFPDFTRTASRAWWGGLYRGFVDDGVAGFWNDMNEPALFGTPNKTMPADVVHRIDTPGFAPRTATHAEIHNVYGMENTRATYDGLRALRPDDRAWVMTRASYAGGQRYAATWTGDNSSTWSHLKLSVSQLLSLGMSGFAYSGADVGGFTGGASPELMTRWLQVAAFTPVFRTHVATDGPRTEPWVDGPVHTALRRRAIEARYRLLPYLYALADENARNGAPLMRPVFYDHADGLSLPCDTSMMFDLGPNLLVAPPPTPESPLAYKACLPAGGWYDFWTGLRVATAGDGGATTMTETPTLDRLPVYVRAGSIVPRQPLVQSTAEAPKGALTLDVYPGPDCTGALYLDDGVSVAHAARAFLRQRLRCSADDDGVAVEFDARDGEFRPWWRSIEIVVHGWDGRAQAATVDGPMASSVDAAAKTATVTVADAPAPTRVQLRHAR